MTHIEKAHKALLTDQPNLAMLYMKRGIQELDKRRARHPFEMVGLGLKHFTVAINGVETHVLSAMDAVNKFTRAMREANRVSTK